MKFPNRPSCKKCSLGFLFGEMVNSSETLSQIEAFDIRVLGERPKFSRPRDDWEEA
jgi:hypothetical protein